jgi:hypothetical protein
MRGWLVAIAACGGAPAPAVQGEIHGAVAGNQWHVGLDNCESDGALVIRLVGNSARFVRVDRADYGGDGRDLPALRIVDPDGPTEISIVPGISDRIAAPEVIDSVGRSYAACAELTGIIRGEPQGRYSGAFHFRCTALGGATLIGSGTFLHCGWF